jgi:hypothetical protein
MKINLTFVFMMLFLAAVSCRREAKMITIPDGQDTPQAVIRKMYHAVRDGDREKFLECHTLESGGREVFDQFFETRVATYEFATAVEKAYGTDAVERLGDFRSAGEDMAVILMPPLDLNWLDKIEVTVDGDHATYRNPWERTAYKLVQTGDCWRITRPDLTQDAKSQIAGLMKVRNAVRDCMHLVGRPGVSVDDLRREVGKRW